MANEGLSIPASGGGLMRYNEDTGSKINLKPAHVVAITIAVVIIMVILKVANL
jgi:preprotein translocase subunit Sec61beta